MSTVLGTLLGLGLARLRYRGRGASEMLLLLPMVTPEIIMGISLLLFFAPAVQRPGVVAQISIAHITFCISYVAMIVRARAAGIDPQLEEAARDLGASAWGAFRHVTLPLLAAGGRGRRDARVRPVVRRPGRHDVQRRRRSSTLPIYIYSKIRFGVTPEINAISTIIVAITAILIFVAWRLGALRGDQRSAAVGA